MTEDKVKMVYFGIPRRWGNASKRYAMPLNESGIEALKKFIEPLKGVIYKIEDYNSEEEEE